MSYAHRMCCEWWLWWLSYSQVCAIYLNKDASLCAWTNGDTFTLHSHTLRHKYNGYCYKGSIARMIHTRCNTARQESFRRRRQADQWGVSLARSKFWLNLANLGKRSNRRKYREIWTRAGYGAIFCAQIVSGNITRYRHASHLALHTQQVLALLKSTARMPESILVDKKDNKILSHHDNP